MERPLTYLQVLVLFESAVREDFLCCVFENHSLTNAGR
jgi:hypothetical protein